MKPANFQQTINRKRTRQLGQLGQVRRLDERQYVKSVVLVSPEPPVVKESLHACFVTCAGVPVCRSKTEPMEEREAVWQMIERPEWEAAPDNYYFAAVPQSWSKKRLIRVIKERWKTERVYQDLKGRFDHFEGRRFPGWRHHVSGC